MKCLKKGGFAVKEHEQETAGTFIVGYQSSLWGIYSDYQVAQYADDMAAVGCADSIALGSLYSTSHLPPKERITQALQSAEHFSAGVRGPFVIESLGPTIDPEKEKEAARLLKAQGLAGDDA